MIAHFFFFIFNFFIFNTPNDERLKVKQPFSISINIPKVGRDGNEICNAAIKTSELCFFQDIKSCTVLSRMLMQVVPLVNTY